MTISIKLQDRQGARPATEAIVLAWQKGVPISARRIIEERVRLEWQSRSEGLPGGRRKSDFGRWMSAPATAGTAPVSLDHAIEAALAAFAARGFLLVADGRQLSGLDDEVKLHPGSSVTFLRLPPLQGG